MRNAHRAARANILRMNDLICRVFVAVLTRSKKDHLVSKYTFASFVHENSLFSLFCNALFLDRNEKQKNCATMKARADKKSFEI